MPAGIQFYVSNPRGATRTLAHPDAFNTTFARVSFPVGSLTSIAGRTPGPDDSVLVTIQPQAGVYGLILLVDATFSASAPTVTFFYGRYGDFSASRAGTRYASSAEFAQALGLWREELLDRFAPVLGSGSAGTDAVGGPITATGNLLAAAPR